MILSSQQHSAPCWSPESKTPTCSQVVCQGTQAQDIRIRTASFECLHEIAAIYYSKLPPYMTEL